MSNAMFSRADKRYLAIGSNCFTEQRGEGGIRTHGALRHSGFQDRRNRPLCHLSLNGAGSRTSIPSVIPGMFKLSFIELPGTRALAMS